MVKCPHKVGQFGRGEQSPTDCAILDRSSDDKCVDGRNKSGHNKENIRQCLLMRCLPVVAGAGIDF